jgi:hypothetical protein
MAGAVGAKPLQRTCPGNLPPAPFLLFSLVDHSLRKNSLDVFCRLQYNPAFR